MRYVLIAAGLVAAVSATWTVTSTEDVTITSCAPEVTNCPFRKYSTTAPAAPAKTSTCTDDDDEHDDDDDEDDDDDDHKWGKTSTPAAPVSSVSCPVYHSTEAPAWFSGLPASVLSSIKAEWSDAPPADWCYYTYSASSLITATPVVTYTSKPVSPASTTSAVWSYSGNPVAPATFTGAANANTGSFALAGLAAAAALVMA